MVTVFHGNSNRKVDNINNGRIFVWIKCHKSQTETYTEIGFWSGLRWPFVGLGRSSRDMDGKQKEKGFCNATIDSLSKFTFSRQKPAKKGPIIKPNKSAQLPWFTRREETNVKLFLLCFLFDGQVRFVLCCRMWKSVFKTFFKQSWIVSLTARKDLNFLFCSILPFFCI